MFIRSIKFLGSLVVYITDNIVKLIRNVLRKEKIGTCVVLYYHVITKDQRARFGDQLDLILERFKPLKTPQLCDLKPGHPHVAITFDDGFYSVVQNAIPELEARNCPATIFIPPACLGKPPSWPDIDEKEKANEVVMDIHELVKIKNNILITIGSHCQTHANLLRIGGAEAREEIAGSKLKLEELLKRRVTELSFPFGAFNENHVQMAKEAGYARVFSVMPDLITNNVKGKFVFGRVRVDPDDWPLEFRLKVYGAYRWLPLAFELKRRVKKVIRGR
jgi:peptidoglycan/xylan/chitin deacetylase (PgdA/CDA1 family)